MHLVCNFEVVKKQWGHALVTVLCENWYDIFM